MVIRKSYVDVADGQLHYRYTEGGEGPTLVFFHMTAASSEAYEPLMHELDGQFPMIAFDTMNYGESYRTTRKPEIPYIAETLLSALTNLGVDQFHTFGHHTGVHIQTEMALQAPQRVLSAIINGPAWSTPDENAKILDQLARPNPISIKGTQLMWAWSRIKDNATVRHLGEENPDRIARVMHRDVVDMLRAGENWHWAYQAVFNYDLPTAMKKTECSKFFVSGTRDLSHPRHLEALTCFPDAQSHECAGAGTYYQETHAEELAPHIARFVTELNAQESTATRRGR